MYRLYLSDISKFPWQNKLTKLDMLDTFKKCSQTIQITKADWPDPQASDLQRALQEFAVEAPLGLRVASKVTTTVLVYWPVQVVNWI